FAAGERLDLAAPHERELSAGQAPRVGERRLAARRVARERRARQRLEERIRADIDLVALLERDEQARERWPAARLRRASGGLPDERRAERSQPGRTLVGGRGGERPRETRIGEFVGVAAQPGGEAIERLRREIGLRRRRRSGETGARLGAAGAELGELGHV